MTESARSRRRREQRELVDANDPLEYARLLVDSVDEDTEKSPTTWLLKAIAIAQIDHAATARAEVQFQMQRHAELTSSLGRQMDMMAPVAEAVRRQNEPEVIPQLDARMIQMVPLRFEPQSSAAPSTDGGLALTETRANDDIRCICDHMGSLHVQGNGACLLPTCGCESFRGS
jgi:hypothetical protein